MQIFGTEKVGGGETKSSEQGQRREAHIQGSSSTLVERQPKLIRQRIPSFQSACPTAMHTLPRNTEKDSGAGKKKEKKALFF